MTRIIYSAVLAALLMFMTSGDAHALRDCRLRNFDTEATLLAAVINDCHVGYAVDTDRHFVRENGAWVPLVKGTTSVTGALTLDEGDCNATMLVTDAADTTSMTLPATVLGCTYTFMFVGSDGGALVDISPAAADAIHGSCTLAASVLEFNGTDDNDVGLTKATANTGDTLTLVGDGSTGWYVTSCTGIWANN